MFAANYFANQFLSCQVENLVSGGGVHTFCMLQLIARSHPDTALIKFRFENSEIVAQLRVFFILVALARVNASYWFTNVRLVLRLKRSFTANFRLSGFIHVLPGF